jgi:hypothetical protein
MSGDRKARDEEKVAVRLRDPARRRVLVFDGEQTHEVRGRRKSCATMARLRKELLMLSFVLALAAAAAPVVVDAGHPVRIRIVARAPIIDDEPIAAVVVDPIYVRDRMVVAAGTNVTGRVEPRRSASTRETAAAVAGGDLTPPFGARLHFDRLSTGADPPVRIAATAIVAADDPAPSTGEWAKDYLLTQLPYHRRYVHGGALLTMTFVEPVAIDRLPTAAPPTAAAVPARLLTTLDSASASVGDAVRVALLAPLRGPDGAVALAEGSVVTGTVTRVSHARAFGRGGRIDIHVDAGVASASRSDPPIRFIWPPLAALALLGARDPASADQSTFWGRAGAGWSGFLVVGALVAQTAEPVALGLGAWGLVHTTWINVLRKGHDVVLSADSVVLLTPGPTSPGW